uniref:Uncharacterized protein n=1 Tax=Meloidogyne enterolobii TaxID=390850 RepID=A0A6V7XJW5_MELEN|nr:unnamed protein product [Meloidogyne enterolobii]
MKASINQTILLDNNTFPNHMLYKQYKDSGTSSALILPAVMMNVAGIPGIAANLLLIFVTIQNNFTIPITFNFWVTAAQTSMASTAADRLLSVLFPLKYNKINIRLYLSVHTILAISSGIWMSINAINLSNKYPTLPVTGYISDLLVLDMEIMFQFIMLLCGINVLLYLFVWIVVGWFHSANNDGGIQLDTQSRLLKSLILIVSIVIGGYVINSLCRMIINHLFNLNDIQIWSVNVFGGILLNIGASAETPTLYIFSSLYREAINKQLKFIFCKKNHQKNVISVVPGLFNNSGGLVRDEGINGKTKQLTSINKGIVLNKNNSSIFLNK